MCTNVRCFPLLPKPEQPLWNAQNPITTLPTGPRQAFVVKCGELRLNLPDSWTLFSRNRTPSTRLPSSSLQGQSQFDPFLMTNLVDLIGLIDWFDKISSIELVFCFSIFGSPFRCRITAIKRLFDFPSTLSQRTQFSLHFSSRTDSLSP